MHKIITTIGTSLINNQNDINVKKCLASVKKTTETTIKTWQDEKTTEIKLNELIQNQFNQLTTNSGIISDVSKLLNAAKSHTKEGKKSCAEIASIIEIQQEISKEIEVFLICSCSLDSYICATAIKEYFEKFKKNDDNYPIIIGKIIIVESLLVTDKETFELGLSNLFTEIETIAASKWEDIVFNITGGYKGLIPHLTILGQIHNCSIYYIFNNETNDDNFKLLKVPFIPIHFNWIELYPLLDFLKPTSLSNQNFTILVNYLERKYIYTKNNTSFELSKTNEGFQKEGRKLIDLIPTLNPYNAVYQKLLLNGLINKNLELTNLGKLIKNKEDYNKIGKSYLGDTMEIFIHFYFSQLNNIKHTLVAYYESDSKYNITGSFKITDINTKKISFDNSVKSNYSPIEIGDIDVCLVNENSGNFVLCEVKALSNISGYFSEINTKDDYYFQIKSRILKYFIDHEGKNQVEFLFLIYDFQIDGLQSSVFEKIKKYDTTAKVLKHIKTLEQDEDLKNKIIVNFITLQKIQELDKYGANKSLYDVTSVNNIFEIIDINQL